MKTSRYLTLYAVAMHFLCGSAAPVFAQEGHWEIVQLPIADVLSPSLNNSGEIVWYGNGGGIFSSTRGMLASSGLMPHLANSGEVVYADDFGGPNWDLVSTTRGRLTNGKIIDVNLSNFDVNALGEAVYVARDTNNTPQIFSTVRHQLTFDEAYHANPNINDLGEIMWSSYDPTLGPILVSTVRGVIPGNGYITDLNNAGDYCYSDNLEGPPGIFGSPHIFSSRHGVLINDPTQFQWGGTLNDAGTIIWTAPSAPQSSTWYLYRADWISSDTTPPQIFSLVAAPQALWPPNHHLIPVKLTVNAADDSDPSPTTRITQVTCNDPGFSPADWEITGPLTLKLRADRSPKEKGRVYTVIVECKDASGNISSTAVDVPVLLQKR